MSLTLLAVLGVAGLALLIFSIMLDGIFDELFGGEPVLPAGAFALSMFGFSGALTRSIEEDAGFMGYMSIGVSVGVISGILFYFAFRGMKGLADRDEAQMANPDELLGAPAKVSWWSNGEGEVLVTWHGQRRKIRARSTDELKSGVSVQVAEVVSDKLLIVEKKNN